MAPEEQFRSFLRFLTETTAFDSGSTNSSSENDMRQFVQKYGAQGRMRLKIPSLCCSSDLSGKTEMELSYPAAVLKSALKTVHPLRVAQQAEGSAVFTKVDRGQHLSSNSHAPRKSMKNVKKSRAEFIQENMASAIEYDSRPSADKSSGHHISEALRTLHSNLNKTVKNLMKDQVVALTSKIVRTNVSSTNGVTSYEAARALSDSATTETSYFTEIADQEMVNESLRSWKPFSSHEPSESDTEEHIDLKVSSQIFSSEEEDQRLVAESLGLKNRFSTEEEDQRLVAASLGIIKTSGSATANGTVGFPKGSTVQKVGTLNGMKPSNNVKVKEDAEMGKVPHSSKEDEAKRLDPLGHISAVKSIHHSTPSLKEMILSQQTENSSRKILLSCTKCSTSFHLLARAKNADTEENFNPTPEGSRKASFPLLLEGKLCIELFNHDYEVHFETNGTISGIVEDTDLSNSKLCVIDINLDIKSLFLCLVRQINQAIKSFAMKQKLLMSESEKNRSRRASRRSGLRVANSRDDRMKAAQALSELESSGMAKPNISNTTSPSQKSKRERDAIASIGNEDRFRKRRSIRSHFGNEETNVRMVDEGFSLNSSASAHLDAVYRQRNAGLSGLELAMRGRSSGELAAELESLRFLQGNGGLSSHAYRRSNVGDPSVASAAEAVRVAEAENNLHSLTGMRRLNAQQTDFDAAINSIARRTSFGSGSLPLTPDAMRIAELEASINNYAGRASFNAGSLNAAADAVKRAEMESVLRRNSRAGDSVRIAAESVRLAELESVMSRRSRTESMSAAAEAVRLAEIESALGHKSASRAGDSLSVAAEAVRRAEIESTLLRGNRSGDGGLSESLRRGEIEADRRRRSSLTEAMKLVQMDSLRRSSTGTSMAAAAEAVRLAEMEAYSHQRRASYAAPTDSIMTHSDSMDNLPSLMRRSSGPGGSMAAAAEAVRLAEIEQAVYERDKWRRSSDPSGHMAAAAEAVRLAEIEKELSRQIGGYGIPNDGGSAQAQISNSLARSNDRRVSFTADLLKDQLSRFQRM